MLRRLIPVLTVATVALLLVEVASAGPLDRLRSRRETRRGVNNETQQQQQVSTQPGVYRSYYRVVTSDVPQQSVLFNVQCPVDAKVEVNGEKTSQEGTTRQFVTPPLTEGKSYSCTVKATWKSNGSQVTKSQKVTVQAGETVTINMMQVQ